MLCRVDYYMVMDVSKDLNAFIVKVKQSLKRQGYTLLGLL